MAALLTIPAALLMALGMARPCSAQVPNPEPIQVIVTAGDLRGEIQPCGCSAEGQLGGLPRRMTYVEKLFQPPSDAVLLDLGNNFPEPSAQGRLKADLIQALLKQMPVQAILPGPNELDLGVATLDPALPYMLSNAADPGRFLALRMVERQGRRIGILGYLSPALVYQGMHSGLQLQPVDSSLLERFRAALAREKADTTLLLFRGSDAEWERFQAAGIFTIILAGNPGADELHQVVFRQLRGGTVTQVPTKGQGILRVELRPGLQPSYAVDWLHELVPDHPAARSAMKGYDERVKSLFFAQMAERQERQKDSPFAGAEACAGCHASAYAVWQQARHPHALASLERVGKQYDPECLLCHVVGLNLGGYVSQDTTPQLANVQCENCHGPAKAHGQDPTHAQPHPLAANVAKPDESVCRTCHHGSHSPSFSFAAYWPKILHGR